MRAVRLGGLGGVLGDTSFVGLGFGSVSETARGFSEGELLDILLENAISADVCRCRRFVAARGSFISGCCACVESSFLGGGLGGFDADNDGLEPYVKLCLFSGKARFFGGVSDGRVASGERTVVDENKSGVEVTFGRMAAGAAEAKVETLDEMEMGGGS